MRHLQSRADHAPSFGIVFAVAAKETVPTHAASNADDIFDSAATAVHSSSHEMSTSTSPQPSPTMALAAGETTEDEQAEIIITFLSLFANAAKTVDSPSTIEPADFVKRIANPTFVADKCIISASTSKVDGTIVHAADGISTFHSKRENNRKRRRKHKSTTVDATSCQQVGMTDHVHTRIPIGSSSTLHHCEDSVASCAWVGSGNRVSDVTCSRGIRSSDTTILGGSCGSYGGLHACTGNVHAEDQNPCQNIYKLPFRPHALPATSTSAPPSTRRLMTHTPPAWSPSLRASSGIAGGASIPLRRILIGNAVEH